MGFPIIGLSLLKDGPSKGNISLKGRESSAPGKTVSTQPRSKTLGMCAQGSIASQHCVTGGWLQTHTSVGDCCPLQVKGTQTKSSLFVLIQLIQNWGHYNGPHSALWGHMEIPQLEASAGHRLGVFLLLFWHVEASAMSREELLSHFPVCPFRVTLSVMFCVLTPTFPPGIGIPGHGQQFGGIWCANSKTLFVN